MNYLEITFPIIIYDSKAWLAAQEATSKHPVRDILFRRLHQDLESAISKGKKRIFDKDETLKLSASTCK